MKNGSNVIICIYKRNVLICIHSNASFLYFFSRNFVVLIKLFKEYFYFINRLYDITWFGQITLAVYEQRKLFQTRLLKYNLSKNGKYSLYLISQTKFILFLDSNKDYFVGLFEFVVGDVTILKQVIPRTLIRLYTSLVILYNLSCSRQINQSDCS